MDREPRIEANQLVDCYAALQEEGRDCGGVVEGADAPMFWDDMNRDDDNANVKFSQSLTAVVAEPTLGMEFPSEDDARNFYNAYAKQSGFSIRVNSYYRSKKDNSIISREFCCGDETRRLRSRPIPREGCKAMMTVRRRDNGKWYVAKSEKNHNHEMVTPTMRHVLRSHREEFDPKNNLSSSFSNHGMGSDASASLSDMIEDSNHVGKMVFSSQNCINYIGRGRLSTFGIDAQSLLGFFNIMQVSDLAFYYAIQVDEEDRLSSVFWVDTRSRISYNCLSDVVAFDTTYQVNQYKMPFAPFTGVNHHKQSVLFGCALLADETESTFIWLFTTWLEAMCGQQPGLIITDYYPAITRAVERVFPQSTHRYCKWHIISKMPKEMGHAYSALPKTFQVEFDKCINKTETSEEFESAWRLLLDKYNLRGNEWLQSLYIDRKLWVPVYVRDTFFAGKQYEKALEDRYEKEAKAEFETFYTKPVLKTPLPMEKQAAEVYTRKLFAVVQEEIFESPLFAVKLNRNDERTHRCEVARFDEEHKHVIAVFKATNLFVFPLHYILKRWTRNAKDEVMLDVPSSLEMRGNSRRGKNSHYNILYQEAIKCAEEGMASDHSFKMALNALRDARIKIIGAKKNAIDAQKLETMPSTSSQDENTMSSQDNENQKLSYAADPLGTGDNNPAN
ncbi:protein FAR1-RELATED SEQUENCE 5-like [Hevea brasiliensis]|uniref:protein FAR1-RELATED SEQUENCE 5-like n=1 Tax=Hevea brasiliensis TaxID=3981 RepID=UPI0025FCA23C|nr:protein FAR1-RELATED SEQUENCE 5-like [Hevea brasiliensis]